MHQIQRRALVVARAALCGVLALSGATASFADTPPEQVTVAEALFVEGKRLMADGRYDEACTKLAESQRIDPGGGTLLALALCHESSGRLALAYAEYAEALRVAEAAGNDNRVAVARARKAAIEPRLGRIAIRVIGIEALREVEVRVGPARTDGRPGDGESDAGALLGAGGLETPLPVDPGEHRIEVRAAGKLPAVVTRPIGEGESVVVTVGPLSEAPLQTAAAALAPAPRPLAPRAAATRGRADDGGDALRTAGWITTGAGALGVVVGAAFGIDAITDDAEADDRCADGVPCSDGEAILLSQSARRSATASTVLVTAGAGVAAVGVLMVLVGRVAPSRASAWWSPDIHVMPSGGAAIGLAARPPAARGGSRRARLLRALF